MPVRSIGELCTDPVETRVRAGWEQVPCYRCIAWTGTDCILILNPPREPERQPADRGTQLDLFRTPDKIDRKEP